MMICFLYLSAKSSALLKQILQIRLTCNILCESIDISLDLLQFIKFGQLFCSFNVKLLAARKSERFELKLEWVK